MKRLTCALCTLFAFWMPGLAGAAEKSDFYYNRKTVMNDSAPVILGLFLIGVFTLFVYAWRARRRRMRRAETRYSEYLFMPEEEMSLPASILYVNGSKVLEKLIAASFMDLLRKGFIAGGEEEGYRVVTRETDHLHERLLIEWFFDTIGDGQTVRISDLVSFTKNKEGAKKYKDVLLPWLRAINAEIKEAGVDDRKPMFRFAVGLSSITVTPLIFMYAYTDLWGWFCLALSIFFTLLLYGLLFRLRTEKGAGVHGKWTTFSLKLGETLPLKWHSLSDDERKKAVIYGIGFQEAAEVRTYLSKIEPKPEPESDIVNFMRTAISSQQAIIKATKAAYINGRLPGAPAKEDDVEG